MRLQSYDFFLEDLPKHSRNLSIVGLRLCRQVQLTSANLAKSLKNSFFGVEKPSFFLGLKFSFFATLRT